jgi:hypothetical protein
MNVIVIDQTLELSPDLNKLLGLLCKQIQTEYDISSELLQSLINDSEFINCCHFLHGQFQQEMIEEVNCFKDTFEDIMANGNPVQVSDFEYCGHLVNIHTNSYVEYCNQHKYLHLPGEGHDFVMKEMTQITKEKYQNSVRKIFQNYLNKLLNSIKSLFYHYIEQKYVIKKYNVNNIDQLLDDMKNDPKSFKSKMVYKHMEKNSGQHKIKNEYYYAKYFKPKYNSK